MDGDWLRVQWRRHGLGWESGQRKNATMAASIGAQWDRHHLASGRYGIGGGPADEKERPQPILIPVLPAPVSHQEQEANTGGCPVPIPPTYLGSARTYPVSAPGSVTSQSLRL